MKTVTLVVARYRESLFWVTKLRPHISLVVYNKGPEITDPRILDRIDHLQVLENRGREPESYLTFLLERPLPPTEWTAFVQGDPFPHSPHILQLLERQDRWRDIQPLTVQYLAATKSPPASLIRDDTVESVGDARARTEVFTLTTFLTVAYDDPGALRIARDYRHGHQLDTDANLSHHFFGILDWPEMAEAVARAQFGRMVYGAMFGVRTGLLDKIPPHVLSRMHTVSCCHSIYGFIFEKLWLHFFGLPFIELADDRLAKPASWTP